VGRGGVGGGAERVGRTPGLAEGVGWGVGGGPWPDERRPSPRAADRWAGGPVAGVRGVVQGKGAHPALR
jgi:hypothetical protein